MDVLDGGLSVEDVFVFGPEQVCLRCVVGVLGTSSSLP